MALPDMSSAWTQLAPSGYEPTGFGPMLLRTFALSRSNWSPYGYTEDFGPRAAYSHSASVGRRPPRQRAYASASYQVTHMLGCSRTSPLQWTGRRAASFVPSHAQPSSDQSASFVYPPASTKAPNSAFETSVASIQ